VSGLVGAREIHGVFGMGELGFGGGGLGAFSAGADGAEMVVGIDAGGVAVGEGDLDSVIPYLRGGGGSRFGFEHWQGRRGCEGGRSFCERTLFVALVVARGAGTLIAEIGKIEMGDVAIGPGDVDAGVGGDMDFDAGGFAAGMEWDGHRRGSRRSPVFDQSQD